MVQYLILVVIVVIVALLFDLLDRKLGKDRRLRDQATSVLVLLAAAAAFLLSGAV